MVCGHLITGGEPGDIILFRSAVRSFVDRPGEATRVAREATHASPYQGSLGEEGGQALHGVSVRAFSEPSFEGFTH